MRITVIGELACLEGRRFIQKEVKVYTVQSIEERLEDNVWVEVPIQIFHSTKNIIDKLLGKTFEGQEYENHVEIDLNHLENERQRNTGS